MFGFIIILIAIGSIEMAALGAADIALNKNKSELNRDHQYWWEN